MNEQIYKLKIETRWIEPKLSRTILIPDNISFGDLHQIIQTLFGFDDEHAFGFEIKKGEDWITCDGVDGYYAYDVELKEYLPKSPKVRYIYDFGDNWQFFITLQRTVERKPELSYPHIVKAVGGFLLEDHGSRHGYRLICAWARNKTPENTAELKSWFGYDITPELKDFDPDHFPSELIKFHKKF